MRKKQIAVCVYARDDFTADFIKNFLMTNPHFKIVDNLWTSDAVIFQTESSKLICSLPPKRKSFKHSPNTKISLKLLQQPITAQAPLRFTSLASTKNSKSKLHLKQSLSPYP